MSGEDGPAGWIRTRLGEVVEVLDRLRVPLNAKQRAQRPGPFPYYGANGQVGTIDDFIFDGDYALLAEDGGHFDQPERGVAYRARGRFWVNNHAHIVGPLAGMPTPFLVHQLNSINWMAYVGGTTRLKLTQKDMRRVPFMVPPLNEQRRIVARIDVLQARSRRARAALDAVPALLDRFRQSVLAAAFRGDLTADWRAAHPDVEPASVLLERIRAERRVRWVAAEAEKARARAEKRAVKKGSAWGPEQDARALEAGRKRAEKKYAEPEPVDAEAEGLPGLPEGWCWASVGEMADCLDRQRCPITRKDREPGPYPYYGANGQVDSVAGYIFDEELVLVTEDETFYGRTKPIAYRVSGRCWVNNHAHVLRANHPVSPDYLCYRLMHFNVLPWLSGTTGRAKLTQRALRTLPVPLAPEPEMAQVTARVRNLLAMLPAFGGSTSVARARLDTLDQAILAKAFRGELVPQDPDDEPASVLLDRIRAERAAQAPKKTKRRRKST